MKNPMKKFGRRCAALALTLALACTLIPPALASYALGSEVSARNTPLGTGATLTSQSLWSATYSDLRTEHYVTYTPNSTVRPVVYSGTYVASTSSVASAASALESQGYRVAAAMNGGFFNTDGTIVGMLMTDGVVRALDVENYTLLGFTQDGRVFIDESKPTVAASWTVMELVPATGPETGGESAASEDGTAPEDGSASEDGSAPEDGTAPAPGESSPALPEGEPAPGDGTEAPAGEVSGSQAQTAADAVPELRVVERRYQVSGFNAYRNAKYLGGLFLYNNDFSSKVSSHGTCVSAILRPVGENTEMRMSGTMAFEVVSVTDTAQEGVSFDGVIPEGCWMLYGEDHNNAALLDALRGLNAGSQVAITVGGASPLWEDAAYGISGLYPLLRGGQVVPGLPNSANPYTAVGVKEDGSAVFYTIDGRQSGYSIGASYAQVAQRLQELGCVSAVALDGGGSTTLGATLPGSGGFSIVNRPSESGRRVNNTIALVGLSGTDMFEPGTYVTAPNNVVLAGSQIDLSASAYDSTGEPTGQEDLEWSATGGSVESDGASAVYTAGNKAGTYVVAADPSGAGMSVHVVDQLSSVKVTRKGTGSLVTALNLEPGDQVDLNVTGAWWNLPVAMSQRDVHWAVDNAIGSIDENGTFTAGGQIAEGGITLTVGGLTLTIPVKVDRDVPFTDIEGHWSEDYVIDLFKMGLTTGYEQEDGTAEYRPYGKLTRAELLTFVTRALGIDASYYTTVELPFADAESIPEWAMPYVQAMYTVQVLKGSLGEDGRLYANVGSYVTREETMTILGRVLAASERCDLSGFPDGGAVSDWAAPHVQTLVALGIVGGSDGMLNPRAEIDRAAIAKLLVEIYPLEKAMLVPRLDLMSVGGDVE